MPYRNKTYVAFDGDTDIRYYWSKRYDELKTQQEIVPHFYLNSVRQKLGIN